MWIGPLEKDTADRNFILNMSADFVQGYISSTAYSSDFSWTRTVDGGYIIIYSLLVDESRFIPSTGKSHVEHSKSSV